MLQKNDTAPDFTLHTVDGTPFTLSEANRQGKSVVMVFLRHLGCVPCRKHVAELRRNKDKLDALDAEVVVLTFNGREDWAQEWLRETKTPFKMLLDPQREVYQAYGMRHSVMRSWSPRTLWFYAKRMLRGESIHGIQGDPNQLGGDVVVGPDGRVVLGYYSEDPTDRPDLALLYEVLADAQKTVVAEAAGTPGTPAG